MSSWLEPFFVAGEVLWIRKRFGDFTTGPHVEEGNTLLRQRCAKIGTPVNVALATTVAVNAHIEKQFREYGLQIGKIFNRKFIYGKGWEWRVSEGTIDLDVRYEFPNALRNWEWGMLRPVLISYDVSAYKEWESKNKSIAGRASAAKRTEDQQA